MHNIHFLLSLYICTSCGLFLKAAAEAVPSAHLLPDGFFGLENFEVLSVREEGDEDVVHIRTRAGQDDCGTDCLDYSGWTEDGMMQCEAENVDAEDTAGENVPDGEVPERRTLLGRARKPDTISCDKFTINNKEMKGILLISPTWPRPGALEKKYEMVYDTGDPTEPLKREWFEMQLRKKRWTKDLVGKNPPKGNPNRCYSAEHVLEWQLLKDFIDADSTKGVNSRCMHLYRFFVDSKMPKASYKVRVAKNNGKLGTDNHFEYEDQDYAFDKWANKDLKEPRAIDWISFQWPGTARGKPPNPWEYELVLLNQDANGRKADVWIGNDIFKTPIVEGTSNTMSKVEANSGTLEWLFENKYFKAKSMQTWPENRGKCKAIYQFMTMMSIAQYHNQPYIQEVMRAQVERIGEAWEFLERDVLPGLKHKDPISGKDIPYQQRGLKKEWLDWMKTTHKARLDKLTKSMDEKLAIFTGNPGVTTKLKRWDYSGIFRREVKDPNCGYEKDQKTMDKRVELLIDAYKNMKRVESELKLD